MFGMRCSRIRRALITCLNRGARQAHGFGGRQGLDGQCCLAQKHLRGLCSSDSLEGEATLHFCIVGSGPAGFYTADRILRQYANAVRVDILDQLPTPFGLVRSGVAPDHPETKNVEHQFTEVARNPQTTFLGNIRVGTDVQLAQLRELYSGVVLAYGAESDRKLSIPGEEAAGVLPARRFVWWYNGHPVGADEQIDLSNVRSVAVLGIGNVALDCARVLMSAPELLEASDIAEHALLQLRNSNVQDVHIIARRSHSQAACTPKELREIIGVAGPNLRFNTMEAIQQTVESVTKSQAAPDRIRKRLQEIFRKAAKAANPQAGSRQLHFDFLRSPRQILKNCDGRAQQVRTAVMALHTTAEGQVVARPTGDHEDISADLVLVSIGYKSIPIPGAAFDEAAGVIMNRGGRVLDKNGQVLDGVYACGWLSRGPSGIIGTNLQNALQVATTIGEDTSQLKIVRKDNSPTDTLIRTLAARGVRVTTFADWETINAAELKAGRRRGKSREKLATLADMLAAIDSKVKSVEFARTQT